MCVIYNINSGNQLDENIKLPDILYVEDDEIGREIVVLFLKGKYNVDLAGNSDEALSNLSKKGYSAILLDINLGRGLSGVELVKEIRKLPKYDRVPIIAVTAYTMREDQINFLNSGCTHYISKPFNRKALVGILEDALPNY